MKQVESMLPPVGTWMQSIAIVWLVLRITDVGVALGLATAQFLPVLVLGAWGGVLWDRFDRRCILIVTQAAYTAVAVGLTVLVFTGSVSMVWIYVLSVAFGLVTAVDNPTRRAFVGGRSGCGGDRPGRRMDPPQTGRRRTSSVAHGLSR